MAAMPANKVKSKAAAGKAPNLKGRAPASAEEIQARIDRAVVQFDTDALDALLAELYREAKTAPAPFAAAIELKAQVAAASQLEGDTAINWANSISRAKRRVAFDRKMRSGFDGLRLVSEGDSWFQYPLLLTDIIDNLSEDSDKAILSLDAAGDVVANMSAEGEFIEALAECKPHAFLLSAGGNDLLGDGALEQVLKTFSAGMAPGELLRHDILNGRLDIIMSSYRSILRRVSDAIPGLPIFSHGYDYAHPQRNGKWLGTPLAAKGIPLDVGRHVIRQIVDMFNMRLAGLAQEFNAYRHVDLRHLVDATATAWHDELHPKNAGYARAAQAFRTALSAVSRGRTEAAMGVTFCCDADRTSFEHGSHESIFEAEATKPTVDRFIPTSQKSSREGTEIDHIVVHYTTSRNIEGTISWFKSNPYKTSSHYIVGRDGELVQMVKDAEASHHAGVMNQRSIGIEHVAATGDAITDAQARTASRLITWLMQEYGIPKNNVIPHRCVKSTSCCGDLFKAFGGRAGADCDTQRDALHAWMTSMGIGGNVEAAFESYGSSRTGRRRAWDAAGNAVWDADCDCHGKAAVESGYRRPVGGHMLPYETVAEQSGSAVSTLARVLTVDAERLSTNRQLTRARRGGEDSEEFSTVPIGRHIDLTAAAGDPMAAEALVARMFGDLEANGFDAAKFNEFIAGLGLRYFTPVEFLFLGSSNASGPCANKNGLPPQSLWQRLANTARMLDEIRHRLGAPVRILSCYRNQAYNACVRGEPQSLHMRFNAIDWRCDSGNAMAWRDVARAVRASDSRFQGGIGTYVGQNFVHIDTRGSEANWQK